MRIGFHTDAFNSAYWSIGQCVDWAHLAGCPSVDTTGDRHAPPGISEAEAMAHMRRIDQQVVPVAERYGIVLNIEPHGDFTMLVHDAGP